MGPEEERAATELRCINVEGDKLATKADEPEAKELQRSQPPLGKVSAEPRQTSSTAMAQSQRNW